VRSPATLDRLVDRFADTDCMALGSADFVPIDPELLIVIHFILIPIPIPIPIPMLKTRTSTLLIFPISLVSRKLKITSCSTQIRINVIPNGKAPTQISSTIQIA
jgi:hypothetical protein